jgi:hypothetical protein
MHLFQVLDAHGLLLSFFLLDMGKYEEDTNAVSNMKDLFGLLREYLFGYRLYSAHLSCYGITH